MPEILRKNFLIITYLNLDNENIIDNRVQENYNLSFKLYCKSLLLQ